MFTKTTYYRSVWYQKQLTTKSPHPTKSFVHKPSVVMLLYVFQSYTIISNTLFAACIFRNLQNTMVCTYSMSAHIIPELNCSLLILCACGRSFCCPFLCRQGLLLSPAAARENLICAECTLNFNIVIVCWTEYSISKLSGDYDDGKQVNSLLFVCTLNSVCFAQLQYYTHLFNQSHIEIRNNRTPYCKGRSHIAIHNQTRLERVFRCLCSLAPVGRYLYQHA